MPRRWSAKRRRGRIQFGLRSLLVATLLFSVLFAVMGGLVREGLDPEKNPRLIVYVVLAVAAPMLVMIGASLLEPLMNLVQLLRRRRK
jgi:hypothetical protein